MGLTFAKSVRVGAVRFNFSGSGIGMSVGIPGLRIGTGPRGAYISGGIGGFRYRRSLNGAPVRLRKGAAPAHAQAGGKPAPLTDIPNVVDTVEHDTKSVLELSDSSGDALLQSINEQRRKAPLWPFAVAGAVLAYLVISSFLQTWSPWWRIALAGLLATSVGWVYWRDSMRKLTVLFYEPDATMGGHFEAFCTAVHSAAAVRMLKAIASTSRYADTKYTGGASQGLKLSDASLKLGQAPGVTANIEVPVLKTGRTTLAFYPDRVLAFQGKAVGAVSYERMKADAQRTQFIEPGTVPADATVVDKTWKYVNKSGGPDRRFKDNRELPVCAYHQLNLVTPDGLDIRLMASKDRAFEPVATSLRVMAP